MGLADLVDDLRCPHDGARLWLDGRMAGCPRGHRFDVARQGYLNLLSGPAPAAADTREMVAARAEVQAAGVLLPLTEAVAAAARAVASNVDARLAVDVGAGTGHHLAAVLELLPGWRGLAVDLSKHAARRAARAHPRAAAVVADVWAGLPVRDGMAGLVLDVFAPRSTTEFARLLAPGGGLVVATPAPDHLAPLVDDLGLLQPALDKPARLDGTFAPAFTLVDRRPVRWTCELTPLQVTALVASGPSAHHLDIEAVRRRFVGGPATTVRFAVTVSCYRRR